MNHSICSISLIIAFVDISYTCYVMNCSIGSKLVKSYKGLRYCRRCANGLGMCFGPRLCCGPDIGCLIDTKVSHSCEIEDTKYKTPCSPYGKSCSSIPFGKCATKNVCCNSNGCIFDENCNEEDIFKLINLDSIQNNNYSKVGTEKRNEKKVEEKLKLAMKHLLHNTKQRRVDFNEIF